MKSISILLLYLYLVKGKTLSPYFSVSQSESVMKIVMSHCDSFWDPDTLVEVHIFTDLGQMVNNIPSILNKILWTMNY